MGNQSLGNYTTIQKLGKGRYGKTRLCETTDSFFYAIKIIELQPGCNKQNLIKQTKTYLNFKHAAIDKIKDFVDIGENRYGIMMEYYDQGNLTKQYFKKDVGLCIIQMKKIAEMIKFLHVDRKICHRDIRPQNIFFKQQQIILSDIVIPTYNSSLKLRTPIGCFDYQAPQTFQNFYSFASDIWSLGILFIEIFHGRKIKDLQNLENIQRPSLNQSGFPSAEVIYSIDHEDLQHLIKKMVNLNPLERIQISQVLFYLQDINNKKLTTFRKNALIQNIINNEEGIPIIKHSQQLQLNFNQKSPYANHFNITGITLRRIDYEPKRYQIYTRQSIPAGIWQISAKIIKYGEGNQQVAIGLITEERRDQKMSGDIDQANSVAYWTNKTNKNGHLCQNGIWMDNSLPYLVEGEGILKMVIDTVDRIINWMINDKLIASSSMPRSYWNHELYVFVALMGMNSTIKFKQKGVFI